eukprot:2394459-Pyramimonas_sp.AAC.1
MGRAQSYTVTDLGYVPNSRDGTKLLGGILVGDASDYAKLLSLSKSEEPLSVKPRELVYGSDKQ